MPAAAEADLRMTRALARPRRRARDRHPGRDRRPAGRPGRDADLGADRRHGAAHRPGRGLRRRRPRRRRVLRLRQRPRRRQRAHDHLQVLRRRLRPGADRPADAPARAAGQRLRGLQHDRHAERARRPAAPEPAQGAGPLRRHGRVGLRQLQAVPVDDGLPAELQRRGRDLRPPDRRDASRRRRSASSTRTATSATTSSPGSRRGSAARRRSSPRSATSRPTPTSPRRCPA